MVVLILLAYGLRRGDLLKLCTGDVKTHGSNPTLWIRRRPDDPYDPRVWEPNAKTQERVLPLDSMLTRALNDYVADCRKHIPNQKKTPYLILSLTNGKPMATRSLNDIFKPLKALFPGIHPHKLRHTHNDRLRAHCREKGIGDKEMRDHAKYLNGWLGDNMGRYTKREARESARKISSQLQAQLFAPILDVPF